MSSAEFFLPNMRNAQMIFQSQVIFLIYLLFKSENKWQTSILLFQNSSSSNSSCSSSNVYVDFLINPL